MNTPMDDSNQLDELLMVLSERPLTPEEQEKLTSLLHNNPVFQQKYLDYMLMDSLLAWEQPLTNSPVESEVAPKKEIQPAQRKQYSRRFWMLALSLSFVVGMGLLLWDFLAHQSSQSDLALKEPERIDDSVAILLHTADAQWGESTLPTRAGSPLAAGQMELVGGVIRLEFYCGATVIVEGPAEFGLISRTRMYCTKGKLRATVPPHASGFTIETPTMDLVDRGTQFGLNVGTNDSTEVHVFQGKVELYEAESAGKKPPQKSLTDGQGLQIASSGKTKEIPTNSSAFVTAQKLDDRLAQAIKKREQEWATALKDWKADPDLRAYFNFQSASPMSRTLVDHAERMPSCDGAIVGGSWVGGRWFGRQGLEFKQVSDRVRLQVPGEFTSITLATWIRIDGLPNRNNAILMADGWEPGELHWQIGQDGMAILGVQSTPKGHGAHYHAPGAITPDRFGHWLHLAVVYDSDAQRVRHYLDGRQLSDTPTQFDEPLRIGDAELGNWSMAEHRKAQQNKCPVRFLNGCIDELMVFSRALSDEEMARLYAQSRPPS